jgi:peptidoglycan hydrolase-like protein with peptidoglycan-binding domain
MVPYVIRAGDHLQEIAYRMGFDADKVWQDEKNADLRKLRPDPNILCPCDILYVPDPKSQPPKWLAVSVGSTNAFTAEIPRVHISVAFTQAGEPIANAACIVHGMPPPNTFDTDGDGKLALDVPVHIRLLTVEFPEQCLLRRLQIGYLDPSSVPSGIWERLRNLGHVAPDAAPSDEVDEVTLSNAVRAFQRAHGLTVTGEVDDDTRQQLESTHGC